MKPVRTFLKKNKGVWLIETGRIKSKALYKNTFVHAWHVPGARHVTPEDKMWTVKPAQRKQASNTQKWAIESGKYTKEGLNASLQVLAKQLAHALRNPQNSTEMHVTTLQQKRCQRMISLFLPKL